MKLSPRCPIFNKKQRAPWESARAYDGHGMMGRAAQQDRRPESITELLVHSGSFWVVRFQTIFFFLICLLPLFEFLQ